MAIVLSGCTLGLDWYHKFRARRAIGQGDYGRAIQIIREIKDRDPDDQRSIQWARWGARVAHMEAKDYAAAVDFYKHLVIRSSSSSERKNAQTLVAQIYFEHLQDFNRAVIEYEKLLKLDSLPAEKFRYRLNLAKSHFQLNNLEQAANEIDVLLQEQLEPEQVFDAKVVKASIFMADKKLTQAAQSWEELLREFPEQSKREKIALNLVVCYEELKDFAKAIEILEGMKDDYPDPDFLNMRISRLRDRKINQPGAQGWKR